MIGQSVPRSFALTRPPIGARLGAASGFRRDLVVALHFNEQGGVQSYNAVDGAKGTYAGTTIPVWKNQRLFFAGGASLASYVDFSTHPQSVDLGNGGPLTIVTRCLPLALSGGIAERNDGNTVGAGWMFGFASGTSQLGFTLEAGTTDTNTGTGGGLSVGSIYTLGVTTDGTLSNTGTRLYINGRDQTGTSPPGAGSRFTDSAQSLRIGNASFNANGGNTIQAGAFNGWMDYLYIWRRLLTPEEMAVLHVYPYSLFAPLPKRWGPSPAVAAVVPDDVPVVTINGVLTPIRRYTLSITEVTNGRNTLSCEVVSANASNRPAVDAEVVVYLNNVRIFAGTIDKTTETGVGQNLIAIVTRVSVNDFNSLADRRYLAATLATGTLKSMLTTLVTYLSSNGVTLDPAQVDGPTLDALTYDYRQLTEILNDLATLTGYVWEIDYDKVLRMYSPGTVAAPFNIIDGDDNAIGDIAVDQTARTKYANRIILRYGSGVQQKTENFIGDGVTATFPLAYPMSGYIPYTADGAVGYGVVNVSWGTTESLGGVSSGLQWTYNPVTQAITRTAGAPVNLDTFSITYDVQFPLTVIAEDVGEQAPPTGVIDRLVEKPDVFDVNVAQAMADAELASGLERPVTVRYRTRRTALKPGMTQTITAATRNINDTFLVSDIRTNDSRDAIGTLMRDVTATQGTVLKPTWREYYKKISGSGGSTSPVA